MAMMQPPARGILPSDVELSNTIRKGWINTGRWLRNFILSTVLGLGNRDIIVQRLFRTADEAAELYSQYYGEEFGNSVRTNFQNYFRNVGSLIEAYMTGDAAAVEQIRNYMYEDADELALMLSRVNRYWDYPTLQALLHVLVDNTEQQVAGIVTGNYEQEVDAFDRYIEQIYDISDELTRGIILQFRVPR